ncbi:MAG: helix-turn-helix domain-containing protein [Hyphomicrobium sp.]
MSIKFEPENWYSADEVCEITGWKKPSLVLWRSKGTGPEYTKLGKKIFYRGSDLQSFFDKGLRRSTAESRPVGTFIKSARASQ